MDSAAAVDVDVPPWNTWHKWAAALVLVEALLPPPHVVVVAVAADAVVTQPVVAVPRQPIAPAQKPAVAATCRTVRARMPAVAVVVAAEEEEAPAAVAAEEAAAPALVAAADVAAADWQQRGDAADN